MTNEDEKRVGEIAAEAMRHETLRLFLIDVNLRGYKECKTKWLMSLLGKWADKPERWREVADVWVKATGKPREALKGIYWGDTIVLHTNESVEVAGVWGRENEKNQPVAEAA